LRDGKIIVARLWPRYEAKVPTRAPIIRGLDRERFETICVYLKKSSSLENTFAKESGFREYYLSKKKFFRVMNIPVIIRLSRIFRREGVDIVHCHHHQAAVYGTLAAWLAGTGVVLSHVHGMGRTTNRRKFINSIIFKRISRVLTVGESVREDVLENNPLLTPEKVVSIGNSIDWPIFANEAITQAQAKEKLNLPAGATVFGTVGRMAPAKGHTYLLEAFAIVKRTCVNAHLLLIGEGRLREELEEQAQRIGLNDCIHFLGRRDDVSVCLRAMDVFVLSSVSSEGLPRAMLEAMASGVPVIGTRVSGIPEILAGGQFGKLVEPAQSEQLSAAMMEVCNLPLDEKERIGAAGLERVKSEYSHEKVLHMLAGIYEQELKKAGIESTAD
jgi:glycosyltransferase involved in cell wall biosynthesis